MAGVLVKMPHRCQRAEDGQTLLMYWEQHLWTHHTSSLTYSSRKPHWVQLLSLQNNKLRLQFAHSPNAFCRFVPIDHCLNITISSLPFMTKMYRSSDCFFQCDGTPCHKAQMSSNCFEHATRVYCGRMASTVPRSQSSRVNLGFGGMVDLHHGCVTNKSAACVMLLCQYGPKCLRNISNTLLILCHIELRLFWRSNGF